MTIYQEYGVTLRKAQAEKILKAASNHSPVTIRILKKDLHGDHKLLLTKTQINKISKASTGIDLKLSYAQLKDYYKIFKDLQNKNHEKTGGVLPLLALLPLIFGGLGAAGGVAGGIASAVTNARSSAEQERHNRALENMVKTSGSGILSNIASKVPVFGETLKYYLE